MSRMQKSAICANDDHTFCRPRRTSRSSAAARPHAREIGFRARLGKALAPDLLSEEDRLQITRLLRLRAVRHDRRARHTEPHDADVGRSRRARHLLEEDRLVRVRSAAAAVLLRPGQPRVARVVERAAPAPRRVTVERAEPPRTRAAPRARSSIDERSSALNAASSDVSRRSIASIVIARRPRCERPFVAVLLEARLG